MSRLARLYIHGPSNPFELPHQTEIRRSHVYCRPPFLLRSYQSCVYCRPPFEPQSYQSCVYCTPIRAVRTAFCTPAVCRDHNRPDINGTHRRQQALAHIKRQAGVLALARDLQDKRWHRSRSARDGAWPRPAPLHKQGVRVCLRALEGDGNSGERCVAIHKRVGAAAEAYLRTKDAYSSRAPVRTSCTGRPHAGPAWLRGYMHGQVACRPCMAENTLFLTPLAHRPSYLCSIRTRTSSIM